MKFVNPHKEPKYNYQYKRRLRDTRSFLVKNKICPPVLVMGEKTEFETILNERYYIPKFDYTDFDLNYPFPIGAKYSTILCFQVIEHLLNPLLFMQEVRKLMKENSLLYISYPTHGSKLFWSSGHFHEYDKSRFLYLVKESGFKIIDYKQKIMWVRIKGIRPIIRNTPLGWCKHQYYCLEKGAQKILEDKDV